MYNENSSTQIKENAPKKSRLVLFGGIVLAFCGVTALLCHTFYTTQKNDILTAQKDRLLLNVEIMAESIRLWGQSLENQAKRVSESELYRLFAQDISLLDSERASMLNDPNATSVLDEDLAFLSEQVPMMRNILLDFMSYNGLSDARLVSPDGSTLLSSLARPAPIQEGQANAVRLAVKESETVYAPVRNTATGMVLDYAAPLMPIMMEGTETSSVAALLLTVPVTGQLANFLSRGSGSSQEIRTNLLQYNGKNWEAIYPDSTRHLPQTLTIKEDAQNLAFGERTSIDDRGEVYSMGQKVHGLDWIIVQEIPAEQVNAQISRAFNIVFGAGAFLCLSVLLMLALVWWVLIGREQRNIAQQFQRLYQVIHKQKHLLDSINISLDVGLILVDVSGKLHMVNRAFAEIFAKNEEELQDQILHNFIPEQATLQVQAAVSEVSTSGEPKTIEIILPLNCDERLFRATLFPFEYKEQEDSLAAAVITFQDITEFRKISEKRKQQQVDTIKALVGTIEMVDPYLAGRSALMHRLVDLLAKNMNLTEKDKDTLITAADLSQIGKIFIPRDILTKTDKLTPEEQAELAKIPQYAYNILSTIDFGMPVQATILQMNEKLNGTGTPNKLQGEEISQLGRALGIVNAFCAMTSPRAFRAGFPIDVALGNLRNSAESYDQQIVEQLALVLISPAGGEAINNHLAKVGN